MSEIFRTRPYDDSPYLIFPGAKPFRIKLGMSSPTLKAFIYQKSNLFGDALPLELAGLDITFQLFNGGGLLVSSGTTLVSDLDKAEIEYTFDQFDLKGIGVFYGSFIFKDIDGTTFTLPSRERIQIVVF